MAVSLFFVGCDPDKTNEQIETTAKSIGAATAAVINFTKVDKDVGTTIVNIVETAKKVVPTAGQSFADAWTPVSEDIVAKLLKDGKLDEKKAEIVKMLFKTVVKGADYIITKRLPNVVKDTEKLRIVVDGFSTGFLSMISTTDAATKAVGAIAPDEEAIKYLSNEVK